MSVSDSLKAKGRLRVFGSMLALLLLPEVASAQQWRAMSTAQSRTTAAKFAHCTVVENRKAVRDYLARPVGGDGEASIPPYLMVGCLMVSTGRFGGEQKMRMPKLLLRGLLFNALIARDLKRPPTTGFESVAPLAYPVTEGDPATAVLRRDYRALMKIGECTARAAPDKAWALLVTPVATPEEEAAIVGLHTAWSACLPGRKDMTFSTEMLRASLAEPFYRLSMASR